MYVAAGYMNAAMLCQTKGRLKDGLRYSEEALRINQLALGEQHVQLGIRSDSRQPSPHSPQQQQPQQQTACQSVSLPRA